MQASSEFKHFNKLAGVEEVVEHLLSLISKANGRWIMDGCTLNTDRWRVRWRGNDCTLIYLNIPYEGFKNVTFETNTTQRLHEDFQLP